MTRTTLARLGVTAAIAGAILAACGGGATTTSPSTAASTAPSTAASESASASATTESPSASASASASAGASGSPAARTVQMYAIEGGFQNPPIDPTPGTILTFRNLGKEAHELVVIRKNDDATDKQTFDDLTKVNPADLMKFATVVGVLAADPGQEATGQITLTEPG